MAAVEVIINAGSGSYVEGETDQAVRQAFAAASLPIDLRIIEKGGDPIQVANEATNNEVETLIAGGGDGTISAVAGVAAKEEKAFGVLPLGTLNHFARDLGIPHDLADAAKTVATGTPKPIDICTVNGRTFINNSSIGLYPRIVHKREELQERLGRGKWSAAFFAALQVLKANSFLSVRLKTGSTEIVRKTPFVFVGNNEYRMELYNIGRRESLDEGIMSVYFLRKGGRWGVIKLVIRTLLGLLKSDRDLETIRTDRLTIETRKRALLVAFDGEVVRMESPLNYRITPGGLKVIVPQESDDNA